MKRYFEIVETNGFVLSEFQLGIICVIGIIGFIWLVYNTPNDKPPHARP